MIEQYTITNKYNFPQPTIDSILPQRFFEQSIHTLKQVQHQPLQLNQQIQQFNINRTIPTQHTTKTHPNHPKTKPPRNNNRRHRHLNHKNRRNQHRHHRCRSRSNNLETKRRLQIHAPWTIHIPHNRRKQKPTLQHLRARLLQHHLRQLPPSRPKHHANAHTPRQPTGALAANYACQNRKPRRPPLRRLPNLLAPPKPQPNASGKSWVTQEETKARFWRSQKLPL